MELRVVYGGRPSFIAGSIVGLHHGVVWQRFLQSDALPATNPLHLSGLGTGTFQRLNSGYGPFILNINQI